MMRVRAVGANALFVECADSARLEAWRAEIWRRREAGDIDAVDIVPGAATILLDGVPPGTAQLLRSWPDPAPADSNSDSDSDTVEIPAVFDGEDLPFIAEHWGVDVPVVVERLTAAALRVGFCGFAPGFAYMVGLPQEWAVPRLAAPRSRVPAGALALAGGYAGIYPTASPGGWRLVGRTELVLFDVHRDPPALLAPGTRVRIVPA